MPRPLFAFAISYLTQAWGEIIIVGQTLQYLTINTHYFLKVGGSLAGLMFGVMLKRQGHNVVNPRTVNPRIESPHSRRYYAVCIATGPNGKAFLEVYDLDKRSYSFSIPKLHYLDSHGKVRVTVKP